MAAVSLAAPTSTPVLADNIQIKAGSENGIAEGEIVYHITCAEEFAAMAEQCRTQNYSTGKSFILDEDIDLSELEGVTVPYMDGVFDGRGHLIKGVLLQTESGEQGLFRYLGKNGALINLSVEGELISTEELSTVGLLCGVNYGLIRDCEVKGTINAHAQVGGICGLNEKEAVIRACRNEAVIDARYQTGGIAGENDGLIADCENYGKINTSGRVKKKAMDGDGDAVRISMPNAVVGLAADARANETGGIAGYNKGRIAYCENKGVIGAKGLGSSSGGIAGRSSGSVLGCDNEAAIYGRMHIAGITGYVDPLKVTEKDRDYVSELEEEIDAMSQAIESFNDAGEKLGDDLSVHTDSLKSRLDTLRDTVRRYSDGYDMDIDTVRTALAEEADEIEDTVDDMDYKFRLEKFGEALKDFTDYMVEIDEDINTLEQLITAAKGEISDEAEAELMQLIAAQKALYARLQEVYNKLKAVSGSIKDGVIPQMDISLPEGRVPKLSVSANEAGAAYERAVRLLKQIDSEFEHAKDSLMQAGVIAERWPKEAKKLKKDLKSIKEDMKDIHADTESFFDSVDRRTDALKQEVRPQTDAISEEFSGIKDVFKEDWDVLVDRMSGVKASFDDMRNTLKEGREELRQIAEDKTVYVDISESSDTSEGDGRILYCQNTGEICGKTCVGGIVGGIVIEDGRDTVVDIFRERHGIVFDQSESEEEEDETEDEKRSLIKHVSAIIFECKNEGDIYAEDDCAAGIIGTANYGLIKACENYADVAIDKGEYAGGIAGKAALTIEGCYSLGGVNAAGFAGGIAGRAKNVRGCYTCSYLDMDNPMTKSVGAIAGKIKGNAAGNYFVDNGFGAIDGVTLGEEAVGLDYKAFMALGNIPEGFKTFKVRFVDQDELIWEKSFKYGDEFALEEYPQITPGEGEYVYWENKNISPVVRNATIHTVRRVYIPSIAAKAEEGISPLVIEGDFYPDSQLAAAELPDAQRQAAEQVKNTIYPDINYVITKVYDYEIVQSETFSGAVTLHINMGEFPANTVLVLDEAGNEYVKAENVDRVGSYLVLEGNIPAKGTVILIEHVSKGTMAAVISVLVLLIIIAVAVFLVLPRRKNNNAQEEA